MICNNCGRHTQNETANFCEYCGASFREQAQGIQAPNHGQPFFNSTAAESMGNQPGAQQGAQSWQQSVQPWQQNTQPWEQNAQPGQQNTQQMRQGLQPGADRPVSFLNWLGSYAVLFIPFANIIMLFIWAFSETTPASKKNWARVTLIAFAVLFLLYFVMVGILMNTPEYQQMYQQIMEQYGVPVQ